MTPQRIPLESVSLCTCAGEALRLRRSDADGAAPIDTATAEGGADSSGAGGLWGEPVQVHAAARTPLGQHRVRRAPRGQRGPLRLEGLGQLPAQVVHHRLHAAAHVHLRRPPAAEMQPVCTQVLHADLAAAGHHFTAWTATRGQESQDASAVDVIVAALVGINAQ